MGLASTTIKAAKKAPVATSIILAFQLSAAVDQFQYEAAHNVPENFEMGDVVNDILWGNLLDFDPIFQHMDRAMGPDEACANQSEVFNNAIAFVRGKDPTGVSEFAEIFARLYHWGSIPSAEIGSFAYESYDTAMKLLYDKEERVPGACAL